MNEDREWRPSRVTHPSGLPWMVQRDDVIELLKEQERRLGQESTDATVRNLNERMGSIVGIALTALDAWRGGATQQVMEQALIDIISGARR